MILYKGPSLIDGSPIVVVATQSKNRKTGSMLQTWIIRSDMDPLEASRTGQDASICGSCIHRGKPTNKAKGMAAERSCYVGLMHAPLSVYKKYKRGGYEHVNPATAGRGLKVRLGSYGDPAAVPQDVWTSLLSESIGHTGYTHNAKSEGIYDTCMASADTITQAKRHWAKGIRTFRVGLPTELPIKGEILCPASEQAGKKTTCDSCGLCAGSKVKAPSIFIPAHGNGKAHVIKFMNTAT